MPGPVLSTGVSKVLKSKALSSECIHPGGHLHGSYHRGSVLKKSWLERKSQGRRLPLERVRSGEPLRRHRTRDWKTQEEQPWEKVSR